MLGVFLSLFGFALTDERAFWLYHPRRAAKSGWRAVALAVLPHRFFTMKILWEMIEAFRLRKVDRPSSLMRRARAARSFSFDSVSELLKQTYWTR